MNAWKIFYNLLVVPVLWVGFQIVGMVSAKAAEAIRGRHGLFEKLRTDISHLPNGYRRLWFHVSSMGEFEQAKPIIAALKKQDRATQIIVTFFSPSGYNHSLRYKFADIISYIPFDSYHNAKEFVAIVKPDVVIFIRYDIWPNHLWAARKKNIPVLIVSATLHMTFVRRLPVIRQFQQHLYRNIDYILTVSEKDKQAFELYRLYRPVVEAVGDTRYDQVWMRSEESKQRHIFQQQIINSKKVFVIGSSWRDDEKELIPAIVRLYQDHPELLIILVPHEPTVENLERIESEFNSTISSIRFSNLGDYNGENTIIIDSVGILMALYHYAHIAYVGGGFHNGIHNVLEPASYGIPVLFGPKHENSQEAVALVSTGAAYVCNNGDDLFSKITTLLEDEGKRILSGEKAIAFVDAHRGATKRFLAYLEQVHKESK
jgi:3-deoxy-D-manno-octulosonic-acid transferase